MRAVGLHEDVIAVTSRAYATGCVLVRNGGEAFCIDSPVFPDELEILPAIAEQAGFTSSACSRRTPTGTTCWAGYAFPDAPLGAAENTAARLINEPGAAQRELRDFDDEFYVTRPKPLSLPGAQQLDVPGYIDIGSETLELHPGGRAHRRRDGGLGAVGAGARRRRLPLAGRDPDALARAGRSPPTSRR